MERQETPAAFRELVRRQGIQARNALTETEREVFSQRAVSQIVRSPEFQRAHHILIYRAIRGELRLNELETAALSMGKQLAYPVCLNGRDMAALCLREGAAWVKGRYGIDEPSWEHSDVIPPENLDMVLCPCTAFDEACNRMGMGAGFYDRYLPQCGNACIAAAAFEAQKSAYIPAMPWDHPLDVVYTEKAVYRRSRG